jgi:hypothetical protein
MSTFMTVRVVPIGSGSVFPTAATVELRDSQFGTVAQTVDASGLSASAAQPFSKTFSLSAGNYDVRTTDPSCAGGACGWGKARVTVTDAVGTCYFDNDQIVSNAAGNFESSWVFSTVLPPGANPCPNYSPAQVGGTEAPVEEEWSTQDETPLAPRDFSPAYLFVALAGLTFLIAFYVLSHVHKAARRHAERHRRLENEFAEMVHDAPKISHSMFARIVRTLDRIERWCVRKTQPLCKPPPPSLPASREGGGGERAGWWGQAAPLPG